MNDPTPGQKVAFQCYIHDGCETGRHVGEVEKVYVVTPTLTVVTFTDQRGQVQHVPTHGLDAA
jgi:hypothetical protein